MLVVLVVLFSISDESKEGRNVSWRGRESLASSLRVGLIVVVVVVAKDELRAM